MATFTNPVSADNPCSSKVHAFTCGCQYISPACRCHAVPQETDRFPIADADVKRALVPHRCRDCMLERLQQKVDKVQQWRDYLYCEHGSECAGHPEMVRVEKELAKARDDQERLGGSIRGTMFDYSGLWTKTEQSYLGWSPVKG